MKRILSIALVLVLLLSFTMMLSACGSKAEPTNETTQDAPEETTNETAQSVAEETTNETAQSVSEEVATDEKSVLTIAHFGDVPTLDPHGTQSTGVNLVKVNIFENLVKQEPDGAIVPELAESWEQVDDVTYTFKLRQDVKFSNGEQMTADDVVYSLARSVASPTTSALAGMIDADNCKAIDEFTVELKLVQPYAPILAHIAQECIAIVSKSVTESNDGNVDTDPVGTGPYMLSEWVTGDHVTLVENPYYWGEKPYIPTVLFRIIPEGSTRTLELESGGVDIVLDLPESDVTRISENPNLVVDKKSNFYNYHIYLNQKKELMANENIRKAISCALDRDSIVRVASEGNKTPLYGYLCSGVWGYNDNIEKYEYDVERAKQYMADAGYPDGGFTLDFVCNSATIYVTAAEIIQSMLSEIGIDVNIIATDSAGSLELLFSGQYDMAINCWVAVAGDPDYGLYPVFHSTMTTSGNFSYINDPKVDELLERGRYETDTTKRLEIYAELQEYLAEKAYDLPMWEDVNINAYQSYVKGFVNDANKFYHFSSVYFE